MTSTSFFLVSVAIPSSSSSLSARNPTSSPDGEVWNSRMFVLFVNLEVKMVGSGMVEGLGMGQVRTSSMMMSSDEEEESLSMVLAISNSSASPLRSRQTDDIWSTSDS